MRQQLGKMKSDGIEARRVIKQKLGKPCGNSIIIEWPIKKGGGGGGDFDRPFPQTAAYEKFEIVASNPSIPL